MKVKGIVESKARTGKSIKVQGEWYGDFNPIAAEWKDEVEFESSKSKCGKYNNIVKGSLKVVGKGRGVPSSGGASRPAFSNLGVELGHASKLALDVVMGSEGFGTPGSDDFYRAWVLHTEKIYKLMKGLRAKHEAGEATEEAEAEFAPAPKSEESDVDEDIF